MKLPTLTDQHPILLPSPLLPRHLKAWHFDESTVMSVWLFCALATVYSRYMGFLSLTLKLSISQRPLRALTNLLFLWISPWYFLSVTSVLNLFTYFSYTQ